MQNAVKYYHGNIYFYKRNCFLLHCSPLLPIEVFSVLIEPVLMNMHGHLIVLSCVCGVFRASHIFFIEKNSRLDRESFIPKTSVCKNSGTYCRYPSGTQVPRNSTPTKAVAIQQRWLNIHVGLVLALKQSKGFVLTYNDCLSVIYLGDISSLLFCFICIYAYCSFAYVYIVHFINNKRKMMCKSP